MDISRALATGLEGCDLAVDERLVVKARTDPAACALDLRAPRGAGVQVPPSERGDRYLAADLTATTFERALGHIDRYRPGDAGIAPWLMRIARNTYIDAARRRRPTVSLDEAIETSDPSRSPEDAAIAAEERRRVRALLATLPDT
jgi:RNA polymerase sigma factor (sigma-70 family)